MEKVVATREWCIDKAISIALCKEYGGTNPSITAKEVIEIAKKLEEYIKSN